MLDGKAGRIALDLISSKARLPRLTREIGNVGSKIAWHRLVFFKETENGGSEIAECRLRNAKCKNKYLNHTGKTKSPLH